jgi:hypothetical protein
MIIFENGKGLNMTKKDIYLGIVFLTITKLINAQMGLSIQPFFGYGKTSVYNKEDTKGYTHANGNANLLPMMATYMSNYGINIGVNWQKESTGLQSIYTGFGSMPFKQNFVGKISPQPNDNSTVTASTYLNYLTIPIHAKFRFGNSNKIVPFITAGLNIMLLQNYSDQYKAVLKSAVDTSTITITQSIINDKMELYNPVPTVATFNSWYYNKMVYCTYFNIGCDYNINSHMSINLAMQNLYSITNPENRNTIEGTISSQTGVYQVKPFESFISKINYRGDADKRGATHLINTGINLSVTYKLFKNQ